MKKNLIPALSIIALLAFPSMLTGCSDGASSQAPEPMTQPIITDGIQPEERPGNTASTAESIPLLPQESEAQTSTEAETSAPSTAAAKESVQDTSASEHTTHTSGHSSYSSSAAVPNTVQPPTAAANPSPSIHDGEQVTDYYLIKAMLDALDIDKDNLEAAYRIGKLDEASFRSQKNLLEAQEDQLDDAKDMAAATRHSHGEHAAYEGTMEELIARLNTAKQRDDELEKAIEQLEEDYRIGSISREDFIARQAQLLFEEDIVDQEKDGLEHSLEQMGWDD